MNFFFKVPNNSSPYDSCYKQDILGYGELALSILEYLNDDRKYTEMF